MSFLWGGGRKEDERRGEAHHSTHTKYPHSHGSPAPKGATKEPGSLTLAPRSRRPSFALVALAPNRTSSPSALLSDRLEDLPKLPLSSASSGGMLREIIAVE